MENYESISSLNEQSSSIKVFTIFVVISQVFGVLSVVLVATWMGVYHGGFVWVEKTVFNFHPLFMVLGLVFCYAEAILVYRVFRKSKKIILKIAHAMLHALTMIFVGIGLKAVFDAHSHRFNLYTLHSWLGLLTVIFFGLQWLFGFSFFLLPFCTNSNRKLFMPIHLFFGISIFVLATATCLLGITEKAIWSVGDSYAKFVPEGILLNCLGLSLVIFCTCVIFLVLNPNYKRMNKTEDEMVQLTN